MPALAQTDRVPRLRRSFLAEEVGPVSPRLLLLLAMLAAAALLLRFPPEQYGFYPRCPIHEHLGLLCPGCGATRALAALLHGHLSEALRLNPLTTLSLPFAAGWVAFSRGPLRWPQIPPAALYVFLGAASLFTLVRNL
ncbi:MAG TPA: DUF2752 domain-containing protein [Edaphobacter sp.]